MVAPKQGLKKGSKSESALGKSNKKGFKGLMKGKTTKKYAMKAEDASTEASSQAPSVVKEEVQVEKTTKASSLEVILLLMDPSSRRFELLQLEFDSDKARVSDILAQIPLSVTEEAIRKQKYKGICDKNGNEQLESVPLVNFCRGMDVLIALPKSLSVEECSKLAYPILSDAKVLKMLTQTGVDTTPWQKQNNSKTRELRFQEPAKTEKSSKSSKSPAVVPFIVIVALFAILFQAAHNYISAPVIKGLKVPPGTWRSKCGLLSILPSCANAYLEVGDDGSVIVYDDEKEIAMKLKGATCAGNLDCTDGLLVLEDGSVTVGGKVVKTVNVYDEDMKMTPWPFADEPKLKTKYQAKRIQK